jgi:hypothetical protein
MLIGDSVTYNGRTYVVVGCTPAAVTPPEVELRDPETGQRFWVVWPPDERVEKAALHLVRNDDDEQSR